MPFATPPACGLHDQFSHDRPQLTAKPRGRHAQRKLACLDAAATLDDLRSPPANRPEALSGDHVGRHSIRVNAQFRVSFVWRDSNAHEVEVVAYHSGGLRDDSSR